MARCHSETETITRGRDRLTIEAAARRLGVESTTDVARAALEYAGDPAISQYGRAATVLAAVRLASRRTETSTVGFQQIEAVADVDRDRLTGAESLLTETISPPADPDDVRSIRRRLVVAREILAALEAGRETPELPGSYLAAAAPDLLARADGRSIHCEDVADPEFDETALRAHVERLEGDLELARLGTTLYALVEDER
ncbi:hypothetical protein [Natronobacterium texcoconense]|uniref:Uncharacterized protein n=1 Tax=Natronobacterium texcoconense TaxID=1095778 RepID=A0A1H0ZP59_NATTX|nr:hypothetical protein [Natronobacterium texcoconense]SDQ29305.1 hypothetical protein SAMN04489842_0378 [Natronobacterium texcoconense]